MFYKLNCPQILITPSYLFIIDMQVDKGVLTETNIAFYVSENIALFVFVNILTHWYSGAFRFMRENGTHRSHLYKQESNACLGYMAEK